MLILTIVMLRKMSPLVFSIPRYASSPALKCHSSLSLGRTQGLGGAVTCRFFFLPLLVAGNENAAQL